MDEGNILEGFEHQTPGQDCLMESSAENFFVGLSREVNPTKVALRNMKLHLDLRVMERHR